MSGRGIMALHMMRRALISLALAVAPLTAIAQVAPRAPAGGANDKPVTMDFPAEGVEVRTLADIVTKRLKIPIIYDESINNKKVVIRVPVDVPESARLGS